MIKKLAAILCMMLLAVSSLLVVPGVRAQSQPRDDDNNAIVRNGAYTKSELKRKMTGDIPKIFAHYSITKSEIDSASTVSGVVRKNGQVLVNGQVVATGAISTGRQNMPGSTYIPSIKVYERPVSVSFRSNELSAFVKMTNGQFEWAVLHSCGNPVKAKPVPKPKPKPKVPKVTIQKDVSKKLVDVNEIFDYRLVVKNTGEIALKNVVVTDKAPTGVEFIPNQSAGTTKTQFKTTIPSLAIGASKTFTIKAKVIREIKGRIVNTACVKAPELPRKCDTAENEVKKPKPPKPEQPKPQPPQPEQPQQPQPQVQPAVTPPPQALPVTGPEAVLGVAASTSVASYLGALFYQRARRYFNL